MSWLFDPAIWIALLTLTSLEVVLGIDNLVFISILASKLPKREQSRARRTGLGLAMFMRIGLLLSIAWIARLTDPLLTAFGQSISGRDIILLSGGIFLIGKSTFEIHDKLVGMVNEVAVMIAAIVIAVGIMALAVNVISDFVDRHPTIKMLALAFLLLIGFSLVVEGLHQHIPKGYIYFAMGFSVFVEMLNTRFHARAVQPVHLREAYTVNAQRRGRKR